MSIHSIQNKDNKICQKSDILLCPICKVIPKIIINELSNEITYICLSPSEKYKKRNYPLSYFNNNTNTNIITKNNININTKCNIHNKKYNYYCNFCDENLCNDCINKNIENKISHIKHDIIELKAISPTGSNINKKKRILESLKKNLDKANLIFEEYISKIKKIWNKIYYNQSNLIEYKQKIIDTFTQIENNYNSINNLNQIFNQVKFINKPFDFINEIILNESTKDIIKKINDIFKIKNYGYSNLDEMNIEEVFVENRNNNLNSSSSTQKQFAIVKTILNVRMNENNNNRLLKEYLICGLSSGILKIYDTAPKFIFKKNIYLNYNKEGFCCNKEINFLVEINKDNNNNNNKNLMDKDELNEEYIKKKNKLYLLVCSNDLDIIEITNNFENYYFVQKIGEANCVYDKADFISYGNNHYILSYSMWLSLFNIYKENKNDNSYNLLSKLNTSDDICISFIESDKNDNYIEILYANYNEEKNDKFELIFYKIYHEEKCKDFKNEKNLLKINVPSFLNDQDCLVKINSYMAGLIIGKYNNDYLNNEKNTIDVNEENEKCMNGIILIDLKKKQIVTIVESDYYINKIFSISGGLLVYNSEEKKINIIKYFNKNGKYSEIFLSKKNKFYFNSDNFDFFMEDSFVIDENKKYESNNEDELILFTELKGGIIALAKNQKIKLYK